MMEKDREKRFNQHDPVGKKNKLSNSSRSIFRHNLNLNKKIKQRVRDTHNWSRYYLIIVSILVPEDGPPKTPIAPGMDSQEIVAPGGSTLPSYLTVLIQEVFLLGTCPVLV